MCYWRKTESNCRLVPREVAGGRGCRRWMYRMWKDNNYWWWRWWWAESRGPAVAFPRPNRQQTVARQPLMTYAWKRYGRRRLNIQGRTGKLLERQIHTRFLPPTAPLALACGTPAGSSPSNYPHETSNAFLTIHSYFYHLTAAASS